MLQRSEAVARNSVRSHCERGATEAFNESIVAQNSVRQAAGRRAIDEEVAGHEVELQSSRLAIDCETAGEHMR